MMCKSGLLLVLLLPSFANALPQSPSPPLKLRAGQSRPSPSEPRARAYRQAVGAMGAAYCYQFSATLEALSVGWQRGGYKAKLLTKRVRQTQGVARAVRKSLHTVELHLGGQDRETAQRMILLLGLLVDQGDALVHFARTRSSKEGKHYTVLRQRARKKLQALLAP